MKIRSKLSCFFIFVTFMLKFELNLVVLLEFYLVMMLKNISLVFLALIYTNMIFFINLLVLTPHLKMELQNEKHITPQNRKGLNVSDAYSKIYLDQCCFDNLFFN